MGNEIKTRTPEEIAARNEGIRAACAIVDDMFGKYNLHHTMQGDCVLAKLNMLSNKKIRKNPIAENLTLKARVERYERMIDVTNDLRGFRWHIQRRRENNRIEWLSTDPSGNVLGPFDTALEAFEAITEVEEKEK